VIEMGRGQPNGALIFGGLPVLGARWFRTVRAFRTLGNRHYPADYPRPGTGDPPGSCKIAGSAHFGDRWVSFFSSSDGGGAPNDASDLVVTYVEEGSMIDAAGRRDRVTHQRGHGPGREVGF
jgi:hypothetical protein